MTIRTIQYDDATHQVVPKELTGAQDDINQAFSMLNMYGVPRERAKTVANGINVLMTRMRKAEHCYQQEIADLRRQLAAAPTVLQPAPAFDEQREREEFDKWAQDNGCLVDKAANNPLLHAFPLVSAMCMGWLARGRLHAPDRDEVPPMQPIVKDEHGVYRFKRNAIVRHLLEHGGINLNDLATMGFTDEDHNQFAQLIGYSVSGFGDLSYANRATVAKADAIAAAMQSAEKGKGG